MRLLVISDTHGWLEGARKAALERGPWDQVVHLGDSVLDAVDLAAGLGMDVVAVRGNNEYPGAPMPDDELVFEAGGVRFLALHGHELDLNPYAGEEAMEAALAELARRARAHNAAVALFGHTHQAMVRELDGVLLVNPGGLGLGDRKKTYAAVTVEDRVVRAEAVEI